jgi:hypothetical protein
MTGTKIPLHPGVKYGGRKEYSQKFICSQCGETIFVFGLAKNPPPTVCAICSILAGWNSGLVDRTQFPENLAWSEELHALITPAGFDRNGPTSLHCIYLDPEGRSIREPWPIEDPVAEGSA